MRARRARTELELRQFGLFMATACAVFGGIFLYRHQSVGITVLTLLVLAGLFGLTGLLKPLGLRRIESGWMAFGERISVVVTFVIMLLTFWVVLTPLAVARRLLRGDILALKINPQASSYWVDCDKEGAAKRYYNPY